MIHRSRRCHSSVLALLLLALAAAGPPPAQAAGARSFKSGPIQVTADGQWVWVVNPDNDSVARIRASDDAVTEYPLSPGGGRLEPKGLAVKEDGSEVWVACHDADAVLVLAGQDGAGGPAGTVLARISLPWGSGPCSVAFSRDQRLAIVANHRAGTLAFVDVATRAIASLQPVFEAPLGICFLEDGTTAWVSHPFADFQHGRMTRIDLSGPAPVVTTELRQDGSNPQLNASDFPNDPDPTHHVAEGGYLTFRGHFAQKPGGRIWVPTQYNNIHQNQVTPDSIVQAVIRTLDPAARTMPNTLQDKVIPSAVIVHDFSNRNVYMGDGWNAPVSGPIDIAFSADGTMAWVACEQSDNVLVFPTNTPGWKPSPSTPGLATIDVGHRPIGLCVSPTGNVAWVANFLSRSVSKLDLGTNAVIAEIATTPVTGERLPASVLNGARLFHTSADPRITPNRKVSCASCHVNGEADGRLWDLQFLPGQHGPRQVQSLLGLAATFGPVDPLTHFGQLHRTGDRDEVQDFEHSFRGVQMGGTGFIPDLQVQPPLGAGPNAGLDADLDDIAAYVLQLPAIARSPFRAADGSLTPAAVRGATFFTGSSNGKPADARCATCHVPETGFTDFAFHDVGSYRNPTTPSAAGQYEVELADPSRAPHQWQVNTPGLAGVFATPPYVGTALGQDLCNMTDVVHDFADPSRTAPHGKVDGLTGRQLRDLTELLLSLDGNIAATDVRGASDTQAPRLRRVHVLSPTTIAAWFDESVSASATNPAAWRITDGGGNSVNVRAVRLDAAFGDRVWLTTDPMPRGCATPTFTLQATGPIADLADTASGGTANALDPADPANTVAFTLPDTITLTLGASGEEDLAIPVHDACDTNQFLANESNGSVHLRTFNLSGSLVHSTGFVRFEWEQAFADATGLSDPADLLDASFAIHPFYGDDNTIEIRRVLQRWWDPGTWRDRIVNPVNPANGHGAPTWNASEFGVRNWNQPNAAARAPGVDGAAAANYFGAQDTASTPDATVQAYAINAPVAFGSAAVTDAFRFWYANPSLDQGYALQIVPTVNGETKFHGAEEDFWRYSPVLTITYRLPPVGTGGGPGEVSSATSGLPLLAAKGGAGLHLAFEDLGAVASSYDVYEGLIATSARPWYSHASLACHQAATPAGAGRLALDVTPTPGTGARYYLVTASGACAEGGSGADSFATPHPAALLTCGP